MGITERFLGKLGPVKVTERSGAQGQKQETVVPIAVESTLCILTEISEELCGGKISALYVALGSWALISMHLPLNMYIQDHFSLLLFCCNNPVCIILIRLGHTFSVVEV